jgi:hypothetical protein
MGTRDPRRPRPRSPKRVVGNAGEGSGIGSGDTPKSLMLLRRRLAPRPPKLPMRPLRTMGPSLSRRSSSCRSLRILKVLTGEIFTRPSISCPRGRQVRDLSRKEMKMYLRSLQKPMAKKAQAARNHPEIAKGAGLCSGARFATLSSWRGQ